MADALSRTMRARVRLIRDGGDMHSQVFYDPDIDETESLERDYETVDATEELPVLTKKDIGESIPQASESRFQLATPR